MNTVLQNLSSEINSILIMMAIVNAILHIIFAGAVAKDAGLMHKRGQHTFLVSGFTWAFATLVGGVLVVGLYWLVHYSRFRQTSNANI